MEMVDVIIPAMAIVVPKVLYEMVEGLAEKEGIPMEKAWVSLMIGTIVEMSCTHAEQPG